MFLTCYSHLITPGLTHAMPARITVIVPTYNNLPILQHSLPRLLNQTCPDYQVIVVDDGSTDGTNLWLAQQLRKPGVLQGVFLSENRGRATARNRGLAEAQSEWVVFVDSDILVLPDFVEQHLKTQLRLGPRWICQGQVIITHSPHTFPAPHLLTDASRAFFATGNVSVQRQALINIGGFDENFSQYGWEDLELGWRLKQAGLQVHHSTTAKAWHWEKAFETSDLELLIAKEQQRARGAWAFYRKHPVPEVALMTQLNQASIWLDRALTRRGHNLENRWLPWIKQLFKHGQTHLALALLRGVVLNHHYLQMLGELKGKWEKNQTSDKHSPSSVQ